MQVLGLRGDKVVYVDETEIKVSRQAYHIWVFVGEQQTIFVIRKSRSKKVIEEVLGERFQETICCDGWSAYKHYTNNLQRCWAHALRESHELKENHKEFAGFHDNLKQMYAIIQKTRDKPPPVKQRQTIREKLEECMKHMLDGMDTHKHFTKFATKLRNGLPYWFTCITNLSVKPTNNTAERALRELVVQRKIIGCLRRPKGAQTMETIHSMLATWKQQNKPAHPTMRNLLSC